MFYDLLHRGGILCLADLDKEEGTFHDDPTGVVHYGFDRTEIKNFLSRVGFANPVDRTAAVIHKGTPDHIRDYSVFLITTRKPQ